MRNIRNFVPNKYLTEKYEEVSPQIFYSGNEYMTSISFEQEPEFEEGSNAADISQYPLEDILDKFFVYVSDFYPELNNENSTECYLEFSSDDIEDIIKVRGILGKHVYNKEIVRNGENHVVLVIE